MVDINFVSRLCRDFNVMYFSFLCPPKNQEAREANFAKYFPPNPQHFAKLRSRSTFLHSAPFAHKTLWRSAERFPALLLQQKHHTLRGGA